MTICPIHNIRIRPGTVRITNSLTLKERAADRPKRASMIVTAHDPDETYDVANGDDESNSDQESTSGKGK